MKNIANLENELNALKNNLIMQTYQFIHLDGNKEYNGREYSRDFESEVKAFEYLFQRNESQSYCYGCKDHFKDKTINNRYNTFRGSLSIGEYYRLMAY